MPMLHVYVTAETLRHLRQVAHDRQRGETAESLAEAAVENAAMEARREMSDTPDSTNQPWRPGQ